MSGSDYDFRRDRMDREYDAACTRFVENVSPEQLRKMLALGVIREVDGKGGAKKYILAQTDRQPTASDGCVGLGHDLDAAAMCDMRPDLALRPDMADLCDGLADQMQEAYGLDPATADGVAEFIGQRVERATHEVYAMLLARIVGELIQGTSNQQARAHALLHAVPGLAALNGFTSMRRSAQECGCSVEWIRKMRARWCEALGLPIPEESSKSAEAREKYSLKAKTNHWRKRTCEPLKSTEPTTANP